MNENLLAKQMEIVAKILNAKKNNNSRKKYCLELFKSLMSRQRFILVQLIRRGSTSIERYSAVPDAIESLEKMGMIVRVAFFDKFDHVAATELGFMVTEIHRVANAAHYEKTLIGVNR